VNDGVWGAFVFVGSCAPGTQTGAALNRDQRTAPFQDYFGNSRRREKRNRFAAALDYLATIQE